MTKRPNQVIHREGGTTTIFIERRNGNALECVINTSSYDLVKGYRWNAQQTRHTFYAMTNIHKLDGSHTTLRLHRLLLPGVPEIDHRDGNGLNNCLSNLRPASHAENMQNQRKRKDAVTSRYIGVDWRRDCGKFRASIRISGVSIHLGYFDNDAEAARARDIAALKYHGEFAVLNFPPAMQPQTVRPTLVEAIAA